MLTSLYRGKDLFEGNENEQYILSFCRVLLPTSLPPPSRLQLCRPRRRTGRRHRPPRRPSGRAAPPRFTAPAAAKRGHRRRGHGRRARRVRRAAPAPQRGRLIEDSGATVPSSRAGRKGGPSLHRLGRPGSRAAEPVAAPNHSALLHGVSRVSANHCSCASSLSQASFLSSSALRVAALVTHIKKVTQCLVTSQEKLLIREDFL